MLRNLTKLLYAASVVVTERLGVKIGAKYKKKEPIWKKRLESQVKVMRRDLGRLESITGS